MTDYFLGPRDKRKDLESAVPISHHHSCPFSLRWVWEKWGQGRKARTLPTERMLIGADSSSDAFLCVLQSPFGYSSTDSFLAVIHKAVWAALPLRAVYVGRSQNSCGATSHLLSLFCRKHRRTHKSLEIPTRPPPEQFLLWELLASNSSFLTGYFNLLILMCAGILPACMFVHPVHAVLEEARSRTPQDWRKSSQFLTTEPSLQPLVRFPGAASGLSAPQRVEML